MMKPENPDYSQFAEQQQAQMLKLVTKGFYNELINYGVGKSEIVTIASHLLDQLLEQQSSPAKPSQYYNRYFTIDTIRNEWPDRKQLRVDEVSIEPLPKSWLSQVAAWLASPATRALFVAAFPDSAEELGRYFEDPNREYFGIRYRGDPVGIIGAENIDRPSARLEMRKLVGGTDLRGKGIGKRATFAFLYYVFMIQNFDKVYIHSTDINIRNLNLNSQFGFQLEGIFMKEIRTEAGRQDVVRMGLMRPSWMQIFTPRKTS